MQATDDDAIGAAAAGDQLRYGGSTTARHYHALFGHIQRKHSTGQTIAEHASRNRHVDLLQVIYFL